MGVPTGGDLGSARGSITIDTSQLAAAAASARAFAKDYERAFEGVNEATKKVEASLASARAAIETFATASTRAMRNSSAGLRAALADAAAVSNAKYLQGLSKDAVKVRQDFSGLTSTVRQLAGAFGFTLGIAGAVQLGKMVVASAQAATAYRRQEVAARSLAGSQQVLNELLVAYEKATGGAVDQATALADVTNLQAIGFAKNAQELQRFVTAARGISIARGRPQGETVNELALTIANQSTRRFDQIGLSIAEVNKRIAELRENNKGMTREMAFQEAVLGIATEKYGELARGAAGQATGLEKLSKSWNNYGLQIGKVVEGPLGFFGKVIAKELDRATERSIAFGKQLDSVIAKLRELGFLGKDLSGPISNRTSIGRVTPQDFSSLPIVEGAREIRLDWAKGVNELNKQLHEEIDDAERDYGRQRADTIRTYNTGILREARDFAINRQRQEADHLEAISDIHEDAARRETRMAEDLARSIADAQADSGERIAEAREDTTERLIELEEDFQKDRERAAEDHRDKMLSAAGRLDAIALLEERKRWARENKDAKEAHDEQRDDLQEQLAERVEEENKALAKSTRQQQEAYARQLEDARENDRLRLEDMEAAFAKQKAQADADRATSLADRAADHAAQLAEMDTAHAERKAQIKRHAAEERADLDTEAKEALLALGVRNAAWQKVLDAKEEALEKMWDKFMLHIGESFGVQGPKLGPKEPAATWPSLANPPQFAAGGLVRSSGWARVHAGEFVMPRPMAAAASGMGSSRSISVGDIHLTIMGTTNMGESQLRPLVRAVLVEALEEVAGGN